MLIIGCDDHTRFQQIAMVDTAAGEMIERRLEHRNDEARKFYASLPGPARVGVEATLHAPWFERRLAEYHHELWVGGAAQIRGNLPCTNKSRMCSASRESVFCFRTSAARIRAASPTQSSW